MSYVCITQVKNTVYFKSFFADKQDSHIYFLIYTVPYVAFAVK